MGGAVEGEAQHHHFEQIEEHVAEQSDGADDLQGCVRGGGGRWLVACLLAGVEGLYHCPRSEAADNAHDGEEEEPEGIVGGGGMAEG